MKDPTLFDMIHSKSTMHLIRAYVKFISLLQVEK